MWTWVLLALGAEAQTLDYRVGAGDALHVQVYEEPSLTGEVIVSDACAITLGLIGRVEVCGRTISEIEAEVTQRYAGDYLRDPAIAVKVTRYHSQRVDVLGEVQRPGPQYLEGPTTLVELLSLAGGPRAENVVQAEIVRADGAVLIVDLNRLSDEPVEVHGGDKVFLKPGQVVYVEGQVGRAGAVTLAPGLTVAQAMTLAGGSTELANERKVVLNHADGTKEVINLVRVHRGLDPDVPLAADDHILVPKRAF